jgi:hypothetical protein
MNTKLKTNIILLLIASTTSMLGCQKEDPKKPSSNTPQEQITTVILKGYNHDDPSDSLHQFMIKWEDLDGDGGNPPSIDSLILDTGFEYHINLIIIDKTKTPFDTVSNEIENLKNVHQFFYTPSKELEGKMEVEINDFDDNNPPLPFGMEVHLHVTSDTLYKLPVTGKLNIVLSHYDGIPKTAKPSPESDIDINIPIRLK